QSMFPAAGAFGGHDEEGMTVAYLSTTMMSVVESGSNGAAAVRTPITIMTHSRWICCTAAIWILVHSQGRQPWRVRRMEIQPTIRGVRKPDRVQAGNQG
ncbi:MAG: hypothetical protein FWF31_10105, partial [Desulfobulbus sp.]|nr:hypothetical protein [Desulfobulbus sp.]